MCQNKHAFFRKLFKLNDLHFVLASNKKHVYMGELLKDRRTDLKAFGQDPFINILSDEEKFLQDLKIYLKTGFKHHFNAFHELVDSPDKIRTIWKSINRIDITEDEILKLNEKRKSILPDPQGIYPYLVLLTWSWLESFKGLIFWYLRLHIYINSIW